jgi:hypothetical protein
MDRKKANVILAAILETVESGGDNGVPSGVAMNIIATSCAICGRKLTDPLSIEIGIGPDCRKGKGFENQDSAADWSRAFKMLGNDCPHDLYEVVADAHGVRKGREDGAVDTTLADAAKAIRGIGEGDQRRPGLCWYLATAFERDVSREGVLRIVLAIEALGYTTLARALAKGLYTRKDYLRKYAVCVAHVEEAPEGDVYTRCDGTKVVAAWRVEMSFNAAANDALRKLGAVWFQDKKRHKKFWAVPACPAKVLFEALYRAEGMDLIAGKKGVVTPRERALLDQRPTRQWWPEPFGEDDPTVQCCWVDEHGQHQRYAITGEAYGRPGWEKVPFIGFFSKSNVQGAA